MDSQTSGKQLFSSALDRGAFSVYFLGAVVPLLALAVVVNRFALPTMQDRTSEIALVVLVAFMAILSLGAFLTLRHMTRAALARMDRDNERLDNLLESSSALSATQDVTAALTTAAGRARELSGAPAAFVFLKGDEDAGPSLTETAGPDAEALYTRHAGAVEELVHAAVSDGRPAVRAADGGGLAAAAVPLPGEGATVGALVVLKTSDHAHFEAGEIDALATLAGLAGVAFRNADLRDAQRNFFSHVTDMLVTALDVHLGFHRGHGQRVAQLSNRLGRAVGLDEDALHRLHFAALLHDIGMLKLDPDQQMTRATCDKHCALGSRMLARIRLWKDIAPVVYHHHEWFDGSGYPDGIAGDSIPLESRIISVCDAVDSMTSDASYRSPLSLEDALVELARCSGTQFDPELVTAFTRLAQDGMIDIGPPPMA